MSSSYKKKRMSAGLRKTQFVALQSLPYYDEILVKIKGGIPCSQIAAWIQLVKKDHTDKKRTALQKQLERLRKNVSPKDIVDRQLLKAKEEELDELVGIVKESQWLLKLNKKRIKRNQETEARSPISLPNQDKAIQLHLELMEMNKGILQDLGMLTRENPENILPGTTTIGTVNINSMTDEELDAYQEKIAKNISEKLKNVKNIRNSLGTSGTPKSDRVLNEGDEKSGGVEVSQEQSAV